MMLDQIVLNEQSKDAYRPPAADDEEHIGMGINQSQYALMNDS